jgi:predicted phage baseplate assembly protein
LRREPERAIPQITLVSHARARPEASARWLPRVDLLSSSASDAHFVVEMADDRSAWLRFGDGELGRAPEAGAVFRARYRCGGGALANLGADRLTQLVFRAAAPHGVEIRVRNPVAARGGVAPEPVAKAKLRGPNAIKARRLRAVTPDDYATIVLRDFPLAVQRAVATRRWTGHDVEILVALDPFERSNATVAGSERHGPDEGVPLEQVVQRHLERYRRIGHDLRVGLVRAVPLRVELIVCVQSGHVRGAVKGALLEALGSRTLRNGRLGFFHPDRLLIGRPVFSSQLVAVAQAVAGVAHVRVQRFERYHAGPEGELERGYLAIGPLEVARLDNDAGVQENGVLGLTLEGGR